MATDIAVAMVSTQNRVKTLVNNELREICRAEGLAVSGVKATLQQRIIDYCQKLVHQNNTARFDIVRYRVMNRGADPPWNISDSQSRGQPHTSGASHGNLQGNGGAHPQQGRPYLPPPPGQRPPNSHQPSHLSFRPSPFYKIVEPLTQVIDLPTMPANRHSVPTNINLSTSVVNKLREDPNLKIMLYSSGSSLMGYELSDISFPAQVEIKVNQEDVKHNYKGLKNKPGTTKPADLTDFVRRTPGYPNNLLINYALTSKRYSLQVNLVRKSSADELTDQIKRGKIITKETVIREMVNKAKDPDIVATSSVITLKDPISTMRMTLPCRSTICNHSQCFDAAYFMQLQEQAPTWTCPICSKTISYPSLVLDQYMQDIIQRTAQSTEQVSIEPNGEWSEVRQGDDRASNQENPSRAPYDEDSDDDLIEISDPSGGVPIKKDPSQAVGAGLAQQTPPLSSRETSATRPAGGRSVSKRPSAVIDLTLSDEDDDDAPLRPAKRQSTTGPGASSTNAQQTSQVRPPSVQSRPPPPPPNFYSRPFPHMTSPPLSANGTSPAPPTPNSTQSGPQPPWHQNYPFSNSPWTVRIAPGRVDGDSSGGRNSNGGSSTNRDSAHIQRGLGR